MTIHWGLRDCPLPRPPEGYGLPSSGKGESVEQNFLSGRKLGVAVYKDSVAEEVYASTHREPLGKSFLRGHQLPEGTLDPSYRFGRPTTLDRPAKEAISPRNLRPETEEELALYRKSHMSTRGGEMLTRNYEWPPAVANTAHGFRFGHVPTKDSTNQGLGVKTALSPDAGTQALAVPGVTLLPEASVHHREVRAEKLGMPRNLNQLAHRALPEGHTFGVASVAEPLGAGALVHRAYTAEEQLPDRDLGRSLRQGYRNCVTKQPLGVPSVRLDKVPPPREKRSVASYTNFGDDASACSLLSPGRFNILGVEDVDFRRLRTEPELRSIFEGAGIGELSPRALESAARACGAEGAPAGSPVASVQAVMHACVDWSAARAAAPALPRG